MLVAILLILFLPIPLLGIVIYRLNLSAKSQKLLLAFSGAFLLTISLTHLLPNVFEHSNTTNFIGYFILLGFLIQLLLEYLTEGIEHGHMHLDKHTKGFFTLMFGLSLHSLVEGMAIYNPSFKSQYDIQLLIGIVLHNIPITVALATLIKYFNWTTSKQITPIIVFASMAPLGLLISQYFIVEILNFRPFIVSIVIGIFLHVSTTILFETEQNHKLNIQKLLVIIIGVLLAIII